jgi:WD40 repeat protein
MVVLWNPQSGQRLITFENNTPSRAIIFDNNSHWLAAGYDDGSVILWSVTDGAQLTTLPQGSAAVNALALSPDGTRMAVGYADGSVEFYPVSLP